MPFLVSPGHRSDWKWLLVSKSSVLPFGRKVLLPSLHAMDFIYHSHLLKRGREAERGKHCVFFRVLIVYINPSQRLGVFKALARVRAFSRPWPGFEAFCDFSVRTRKETSVGVYVDK